MKALLVRQFGVPGEVEEVDPPVCAPDGVVLEVRATGLCRSDWHGWVGHDSDVRLPHVPGHELAGVIAELGEAITGWQVGDRVTVPFVCACGQCEQCRAGQQQVCLNQRQPGFTDWGSFAEQVIIPQAQPNLVRIPEAVDFATAAALGCRFSTAFHALTAQAPVGAGQWVAVHGCGGVGLSAVEVAVASGARVVAVDVSPDALVAATALGAEVAVRAEPGVDVVARIVDVTGGGAHVSVDALGSTATCINSVRCLRVRGTHVQVGLMLAGHSSPPLPMDIVVPRELRIVGSHGMSARDFPAMLAMIADGRLAPQRLIRRRIGLDEAGAALAALGDEPGHGGITVLELSS